MRYQRGFTLVELLIVLFLMGLMLALVGPRITSGFATISLKSTARKIATTLRYARGQAVARKTPQEVFFDNEEGIYGIEEVTLGQDQQAVPKQTGAFRKLPKEIKLKDRNTIRFYPNGSSSGGKVLISNKNDKGYLIGVDIITGLVRISRDAGEKG